ncbi:MAG: GTPase, partial [Nitrososphaeraceae archaeon]|nr:GTPase [Nitrososphaeraceae archaeon]
KKARNNFLGLIDENILEDLPFKTERWSRNDRNRVADALWQKSYAEEFQQSLREHISQHFPRLVIPQAIERFNIAAGNAITEWALQTTTAILNSSEECYQQECEKISWIKLTLEQFLQISDKNLREPFEKIQQVLANKLEDDNEVFSYLKKTILDFTRDEKKPYKELGDKLYPLYGWKTELGQGINKVLESVAKSLENGTVILDAPSLKKANVIHVNLLGNCLRRLISLGYTTSVAKSGKTIEARTETEKINLKQLNEELNELAMHLNLVMEDVLKQIINQASERMYESVVELFNFHLSYLETGANNQAPNIAIKFPESQLVKIDSKPNINVRFEAGFPITADTWKEEINVPREEGIWYTLFLLKRTVYDTKYETRLSENGNIPSVECLLAGWLVQARHAESEIVKSIITWLLEQINCLKKNVGQIQNDVLYRYKERLDTAKREISIDYEMQKNVWQPMQQKAQKLAEDFNDLEIFF